MTRNQAVIRCRNKYYQFHIRRAQSGQPYLTITESRHQGTSLPQQATLYIFPEYATKFAVVLTMMLGELEAQRKAAPTAEIQSQGAARGAASTKSGATRLLKPHSPA